MILSATPLNHPTWSQPWNIPQESQMILLIEQPPDPSYVVSTIDGPSGPEIYLRRSQHSSPLWRYAVGYPGPFNIWIIPAALAIAAGVD